LSSDTFEVIVVDNNSSTSETWQVCKEYQAIRYVFERKQGRSATLNTGIKNAKGAYIAFADDDVIIEDPKWLTKLVSNFENQSEVGYVSGKVTAYSCETRSQRMWERKGGLSKGNQRRQFGYDFFKQKRLSGVPLSPTENLF
jgi:glycosyltransferase involved in cell wall biosynthesis